MSGFWRSREAAKSVDIKQLKIGVIDSLRGDLGFRLKIISYAVGVAVVIILAATVVISVLVWQSSADPADRLAGMGAIFAGMTLLLTIFAVVVAYLAFSLSLGVPDLKLQVCFGTSDPNRLAVMAEESKNGWLEAKDPALAAVAIRFRNAGTIPAKAPAVTVQLLGMEFTGDIPSLNAAGWTVNQRSKTGITAVQWNDGAAYPIYEGLVLELPVLNLAGLRRIPGRARWAGPFGRLKKLSRVETDFPIIATSILTDTSRKVEFQPVDFIVNGESRFPPEETNAEWL